LDVEGLTLKGTIQAGSDPGVVEFTCSSVHVDLEVQPNGAPNATSAFTLVLDDVQCQDPQIEIIEGVNVLEGLPGVSELLNDLLDQVISQFLQPFLLEKTESLFLDWLAKPVEIYGGAFTVGVEIQDLIVQPTGVEIALSMGIQADAPVLGLDAPGFPVRGSKALIGSPTDGFYFAISEDLLQMILYEGWRSGVLSYLFDQTFFDEQKAELEFVTGLLGDQEKFGDPILNPETPMEVSLASQLPPVMLVSGDGGASLHMVLGELQVLVETAQNAEQERRFLVDARLTCVADFDFAGSVKSPALQVRDLAVHVDVMNRSDPELSRAVDNFIAFLRPELSSLLMGIAGPIAFPSVGAMLDIDDVSISVESVVGGVLGFHLEF
jgi:hypothetical protein